MAKSNETNQTTKQNRQTKMQQLLHCRVKVQIGTNRHLVGEVVAFDKFFNLVLKDCQELRSVKSPQGMKEIKRILGLAICRGEHLDNLTVLTPAPKKTNLPSQLKDNSANASASVRPIQGIGAQTLVGAVPAVGIGSIPPPPPPM